MYSNSNSEKFEKYKIEKGVINRIKTDELLWISIFLTIHGLLINALVSKEPIFSENIELLKIIQIGVFLIYIPWLWQLSNIRRSYYSAQKKVRQFENKKKKQFCWLDSQPFNTALTIAFLNLSVSAISSAIVLSKMDKLLTAGKQLTCCSIIVFGALFLLFIGYFILDFFRMGIVHRED